MNTLFDTPRSDHMEDKSGDLGGITVPTSFARQLERENAELREKMDRLADEWEQISLVCKSAETLDLFPKTVAQGKTLSHCAAQLRAILNEGQAK